MNTFSPLDVRAAQGSSRPPLAPHVAAYLADVVAECDAQGRPLVSLVLFGSAATGGYVAAVSDVDLVVVVADGADATERRRVREVVSAVEARHGVGKRRDRTGGLGGALAAFADRMTGNVRAFFVCTRADLLSGAPGRILGLSRAQARFVDRVAIAGIVGSGMTVWGEDLLAAVPLSPIRRVDVAKAFVGLFNQALLAAAWYPLLPGATRYAMGALKSSVHNCYFCHHGKAAPLATEIAFFEARGGPIPALGKLLALRKEYRPSFAFVVSCLPALARLHARTAREAPFPRDPRGSGCVS